jgi:hypothetical protein
MNLPRCSINNMNIPRDLYGPKKPQNCQMATQLVLRRLIVLLSRLYRGAWGNLCGLRAWFRWQGESRGDGVFTLACTPGKSLEPVFVIRTVPCNDTYLPTYLQLISTSEFSFGPRNWPLHNLFSTSLISAQFPLKRKDLHHPLSLILTPIIFCSHHLGPLYRASYTLNHSSVASVTNIGTPLARNKSTSGRL